MLKDLVTSMTMLNGVSQDERQAWERFAQHKEKFDPSKGSLRNWLMMRLKNLLLDVARQRASEKERKSFLDALKTHSPLVGIRTLAAKTPRRTSSESDSSPLRR